MKTRKQIIKLIQQKEAKIKALKTEISELEKENLLLSDKNQWFIEKEEQVIVSHRPKKIETQVIGIVFWKENFIDEDTGEVFSIERNIIVRKNGDWI